MKTSAYTKSEYSFLSIPIEEFLSQDDINYYQNLKETISSHVCRNCRNKRLESFNKILITIRYFINRRKEDDWKRSLLCGICWYKYYICVNIKQMSYLLEKCKSSINGSLQRLFLMVLPDKKQSTEILLEAIPYFKNHPELLHMWSVRQKMNTPQNVLQFMPITPIQVCNVYQYQYQFKPINYVPKVKPRKRIKNISTNTKIDEKANLENEFSTKSEQNSSDTNTQNIKIDNIFDNSNLIDDVFDKYDIF